MKQQQIGLNVYYVCVCVSVCIIFLCLATGTGLGSYNRGAIGGGLEFGPRAEQRALNAPPPRNKIRFAQRPRMGVL